jgi:hypothetical protein
MSQEYFEEAEAGALLIAVLAPEPRLVTEPQQILSAHGARHMRFYDDKCIPTSCEMSRRKQMRLPDRQ